MNDATDTLIHYLPPLIGFGMLLGFAGIAGWVFTTWLRVRNGYPLETSWGKAIYPMKNEETVERVRLLEPRRTPSCAPSSARSRTGSPMSSASSPTGSISLTNEIESLRGPTN